MKLGILISLLILAVYAASMYYVEESKTFTVEKEINYPIEKVFPQFNNLQNFTRWNKYFSSSKDISISYFSPYEGKDAALSFEDKKTGRKGEMYIRYENPYSTLKYQLFEEKKVNPYLINVKFKKVSPTKTKVIWFVHTPKQPWLKRSVNLWTESDFVDNLDKSITNLANTLGNKVDKDEFLTKIKYDSIMVEEENDKLLLGINVSTSNKGDQLIKNIVLNHNKIYNFVTVDLDKQEDEFGLPVLLTDANNYKDNEVSYFYGIPVSKRLGVSDNNFSFRTVKASKYYVIYYQGSYKNRIKSVQQLLQKAKKDTMRFGDLQQTFIEQPTENKPVNIKLSLPVYR